MPANSLHSQVADPVLRESEKAATDDMLVMEGDTTLLRRDGRKATLMKL